MDENFLLSLISATKEISQACGDLQQDELPGIITKIERHTKVISSWLVQFSADSQDIPQDLQTVITEIKGVLENTKTSVKKWVSSHANSQSTLKYLTVGKNLAASFGPAIALYISLMDGGIYIIILLVLAVVGFFVVKRDIWNAVTDAWNLDNSLSEFTELEGDLRDYCKQLRHFATLKSQMKKERKFDVVKVLEKDPSASKFWCLHFGANTSSIATERFIEVLLLDFPLYVKSRRDQQKAMYETIRDVIDANGDGDVSPTEFAAFLQYFGPLDSCVDKVVNSLLDFGKSPPTRFSWFHWTSLDRRTVEEKCPAQGVGTFIIRASSTPGEFALSYVRQDKRVVHVKIYNTPQGFHLVLNNDDGTRYPTLQALVEGNNSTLLRPYIDPEKQINLNIGGKKFKCKVSTFLDHPDTAIGHMLTTGNSAFESDEIFFDRNGDAFSVLLDYYRTGEWYIPTAIPRDLVAAEAQFFGLPEPPQTPVAHTSTHTTASTHTSTPAPTTTHTSQTSGDHEAHPEPAHTESAKEQTHATREVKPLLRESGGSSAGIVPRQGSSGNIVPGEKKPLVRTATGSAGSRIVENTPYFHGAISESQADGLLSGLEPGTFLSRNSSSEPASILVFSRVGANQKVVHTRLFKLPNNKWSLSRNPETDNKPIYDKVGDFIKQFPVEFSKPLPLATQQAYEMDSSYQGSNLGGEHAQ